MSGRTPRDILAAVLLNSASKTTDPNERISDLKAAAKLKPDDVELAEAIAILERRRATGPTYVAIERATVVGQTDQPIEGQIFVAQADGSLKPCDGQDLVRLEERWPGFAKNWRLDEP